MRTLPAHLWFMILIGVVWTTAPAAIVHAQRGEEREVMRLPKSLSHVGWISPTTILATLTGAGYGNNELVVIDISKQEIRSVAQGGCGSPSPDQATVAWIPGPATRGGVWLMDLRSGARRRLMDGQGAGCVAWSPDGRTLAVLSVDQTGVSNRDDILIVDVSNGRVTETIANNNLYLVDAAWTPDSQRLAFGAFAIDLFRAAGRLYPTSRIEVYSFRDRRRAILMQVPADTSAHDLAFSPDGRVLAMGIGSQIYLYDGTSIQRITTGRNPLWFADGKTVLFSRGYDCSGFLCAGDALYTISLP